MATTLHELSLPKLRVIACGFCDKDLYPYKGEFKDINTQELRHNQKQHYDESSDCRAKYIAECQSAGLTPAC